jgi:hypothetical protein
MAAENPEIRTVQKPKNLPPSNFNASSNRVQVARKKGDEEAENARAQAMKWADAVFGDEPPKKGETPTLSDRQKEV